MHYMGPWSSGDIWGSDVSSDSLASPLSERMESTLTGMGKDVKEVGMGRGMEILMGTEIYFGTYLVWDVY